MVGKKVHLQLWRNDMTKCHLEPGKLIVVQIKQT